MSTADAQPEAPLATPSLQSLSNEVCLAVMGNSPHPAKALLKGRLAAARR